MSYIQGFFSQIAEQALATAQTEAEAQQHSQVQPEHLLLGLLAQSKAAAGYVLGKLDVDIAALESDLRRTLLAVPAGEAAKVELSDSTRQVLERAVESAANLKRRDVSSEHLLIGLLRHPQGKAYSLLRQHGVNYNAVLNMAEGMPAEKSTNRPLQEVVATPAAASQPEPLLRIRLTPIVLLQMVSPVFWAMVFLVVFSGAVAYNGWADPGIAIFVFVTAGWVVSLSLHEFGHAVVAFWGGDESVMGKGYLSLNPLRYTHSLLSVVVPLVILALGGIGLPGGAVYINHGAIPDKRVRSFVSAAGPLMTASFALLLAVPFWLGLDQQATTDHSAFWSGLAFLLFIQLTALVFNMLPLPGLDGFGILRPFLPPGVVQAVSSFGMLTMLLIFYLFLQDTPISRSFWLLIGNMIRLVGLDANWVMLGIDLYRFW